AYQEGENLDIDAITKIAFSPFRAQFERDNEKYDAQVNRNRNNGLKGGRPKRSDNQEEPKKPTGLSGNPKNPEKGDSDSDSDSDSKKNSSTGLDLSSWPSIPSDQLMGEWRQLRKRLKAGITQTVIDRTGKELHKAVSLGFTVDQCFEQWIYKGWRGFEAEWMAGQKFTPTAFNNQNKKPRAFGA
ncbi:MAG: DUF6291 domain-containing protein, partial [Hafnia sp.]